MGNSAKKARNENGLNADDRIEVKKSLYVGQGEGAQLLEGWKGSVVEMDDKNNALISVDHPSVERWVLAKHHKFLRVLKIKSNEGEGPYVVDHDNLKVESDVDRKKSMVLGKLARGKKVNVVGVVKTPKRLRGRIEDKPGPGWITLRNEKSGTRFAVSPDPEATTGVFRNIVRQHVYQGIDMDSKKLHKLDAGMAVNVADVVYTRCGEGVRGRITSPFTGWITLCWEGADFAEPVVEQEEEEGGDGSPEAAADDAVKLEPREKFASTDEYILHVQGKLQGAICEHKQLIHEVKRARKEVGESSPKADSPKAGR